VPFIGEIPLTSQIMKGSDTGTSVILSDPDSEYAQAFYKISKITAGRISVIASELMDQEKAQEQAQQK
jgi:ATP-binding protein involved in chromosome partitioning